MGDVQYRSHSALLSDSLMYWKETKSFADGCSAHISGSFYDTGTLLMPDGGAIIIKEFGFLSNLDGAIKNDGGTVNNVGGTCEGCEGLGTCEGFCG